MLWNYTVFLLLFPFACIVALPTHISNYRDNADWTMSTCEKAKETFRLSPKMCNAEKRSNYMISRLLITGSARSGTTMISKLISSMFFPFSNDVKPPTGDGMTSWEMAAPPSDDCSTFWHQKNSSLIRFRHIFHVVRNPLGAIRSLLTEYNHWKAAPRSISKIIPNLNLTKGPHYCALQVWVEWNSWIDRFEFIPFFRVEDLDILLVMKQAGYEVSSEFPAVTEVVAKSCYDILKGHNHRVQSNSSLSLTWDTLTAVDPHLAARAKAMAHAYGYRYNSKDTLKVPPGPEDGDNSTATTVHRNLEMMPNIGGFVKAASKRVVKTRPTSPIKPPRARPPRSPKTPREITLTCKHYTRASRKSKASPKPVQRSTTRSKSLGKANAKV